MANDKIIGVASIVGRYLERCRGVICGQNVALLLRNPTVRNAVSLYMDPDYIDSFAPDSYYAISNQIKLNSRPVSQATALHNNSAKH